LPSIPLAGQLPTVKLTLPTLLPPMPPKFQPEPVRKPQLEGNRPLLPPTATTLTQVPAQTLPTMEIPVVPSNLAVPPPGAPGQLAPIRAPIAVAAPPSPPIPLPAPPAPTVNLQVAPLKLPASSVPSDLPQLQATAVQAAVTPAPPVPVPALASAQVELHAPAVRIEPAAKPATPAIQPPVAVELPPSSATAATVATASTVASHPLAARQLAALPAPATSAEPPAVAGSPQQADSARSDSARDVSTAPNATPLGSDSATPGEPKGVSAAAEPAGSHGAVQAPAPGNGKESGPGKVGGNRPGAAQGELHGAPDGYVQLRPHGDTRIMDHRAPDIGYRPTRFDPDWTPDGESSIDTALRRAVEKTTIKHTFHLPRGVRVGCELRPLLPIALFGCGNPDPPPTPVAQKVYDQLDLPPARPLAPPAPASVGAPAAARPIELDNSAECATARITGGPLPPGCEGPPPSHPAVTPSPVPAASSSSWVPASDQFH
jgi:hypothetical protein